MKALKCGTILLSLSFQVIRGQATQMNGKKVNELFICTIAICA